MVISGAEREPNLGKTNPCVSLPYSLAICFAPPLTGFIIFLTLTRLVVVIVFENFSFTLFTPPLGDFQSSQRSTEQSRISNAHKTQESECQHAHKSQQELATQLKEFTIPQELYMLSQ